MSRMSSEQPRSVPDPAGDDYDRMMSRWLAEQGDPEEVRAAQAAIPTAIANAGAWPLDQNLNAGLTRDDQRKTLSDFQNSPPIGHPGLVESFVPVWGTGREALADLQERDYPWAPFNTALLLADGGIGANIAEGLLKGGVKIAGPHVWRMKPSPSDIKNGVMDTSTWMRQVRNGMRHLEPNQPGHHWAVPQNGWGRIVPDWIKNQPWNIKPMPDKVVHGRIHAKWLDLPRFNWLERLHYGVPTWPNLIAGSYLGRAADGLFDRPPAEAPPPQAKAKTSAPTAMPQTSAALSRR